MRRSDVGRLRRRRKVVTREGERGRVERSLRERTDQTSREEKGVLRERVELRI